MRKASIGRARKTDFFSGRLCVTTVWLLLRFIPQRNHTSSLSLFFSFLSLRRVRKRTIVNAQRGIKRPSRVDTIPGLIWSPTKFDEMTRAISRLIENHSGFVKSRANSSSIPSEYSGAFARSRISRLRIRPNLRESDPWMKYVRSICRPVFQSRGASCRSRRTVVTHERGRNYRVAQSIEKPCPIAPFRSRRSVTCGELTIGDFTWSSG